MPQRVAFLVCWLFLAHPVLSQQTGAIKVHVRGTDGTPIEGATVYVITNPTKEAETDKEGRSVLSDLPPGFYFVLISHPYLPGRFVTGVRVTEGTTVELVAPKESDIGVAHQSLDQFSLDWYTKHLKAMNEPSLCSEPVEPSRHAYRFLWLRTFDRPILVSVSIRPDGKGEVRLKILGGAGGYEPGKLVRNSKRALPKEKTQWLIHFVDDIGLWEMPTRLEVPDRVGLDGAHWITEAVRDGKCHIVDRWSPDSGLYRAWGTHFLIDLAGLKLLYQDVY